MCSLPNAIYLQKGCSDEMGPTEHLCESRIFTLLTKSGVDGPDNFFPCKRENLEMLFHS